MQLGFNIQPRHRPIENIRSRQLVSYPFILLSMVTSKSRHRFMAMVTCRHACMRELPFHQTSGAFLFCATILQIATIQTATILEIQVHIDPMHACKR